MRYIIILFALFTIGCTKKQAYYCTGTINGTMGMWSPNGGQPISKLELYKHIRNSKDLGYTDITCKGH